MTWHVHVGCCMIHGVLCIIDKYGMCRVLRPQDGRKIVIKKCLPLLSFGVAGGGVYSNDQEHSECCSYGTSRLYLRNVSYMDGVACKDGGSSSIVAIVIVDSIFKVAMVSVSRK